ncbi:MAG: hypothetical protein J6D47_15330 [Peptostreptococcaceae bacterium]|nr:hypothetical protein [Peptostreptococcaceae bacterium]
MNELLKIKRIIKAQIAVTQEMIDNTLSRENEDLMYVKIYIKELRAKINAWETTLKLVQNEIMFAEKELEDMKIFQANTEATYFG